MNFDVEACTIFLSRSGSHAYGTNIESSDEDFKGVCVPPKSFVLGPFFNFEQKEELVSKGAKYDKVVFSLSKFIKLASACNPNVVELLFTDESDWIVCTDLGRILVDHRDLFVTKEAKARFSGYAHSQLHRIKRHRSWLLNPIDKQPQRSDFGLPDGKRLISKSAMGAVDEIKSRGYSVGPEAETVIQKEKQYATALNNWRKYQHWKKNRNPARAAMEAKFGVDLKHALHLLRLQSMCVEILSGKGIITKRPDAAMLLDVRGGVYSYEEIIEMSDKLEAECNALYETSTLPSHPDVHKLNDLCVQLHEKFWSLGGS